MDITRTRLGNYDVTWSTYSFGAVDGVKVKLKMKKKEIKVGSVGDVVVGKRVIALEPEIEVAAREIDLAFIKKMCPWWSSGAVALIPATVHKDMYDYAAALILHPTDITGTTEDLNFTKAVPIFEPMERDGEKDDVCLIGFEIFPDRAQLPVLSYGTIGP